VQQYVYNYSTEATPTRPENFTTHTETRGGASPYMELEPPLTETNML